MAEKRGKLKKMEEGPRKTLTVQREGVKAQIRAKVEHPFHVVKNLFRHRKVRYRGAVKEHGAVVYVVRLGQSRTGTQTKSVSMFLKCA